MRSSDATLNSKAAAGSLCDWCGETCDPDVAELNALTCTFAECPPEASVYHQDCVEKYLKSIKLDKCVGPRRRGASRARRSNARREISHPYSDEPRATRTAHSPRVS